jgi:outer membrane protein OmpA-like peptidoglycan-associated protein
MRRWGLLVFSLSCAAGPAAPKVVGPPVAPPPVEPLRPDRDADGVADHRDNCPEVPEDQDRFDDEDGCPDPDNDHDRLLDANDQCPDEPEVYNGVLDDDGCPDKGYVSVGPHLGITEKIHFGASARTPTPFARVQLDGIAATLHRHARIRLLEVQGHAAANERRPEKLAQARADAVRAELLSRNVAPARVVARGYGADNPVCREDYESCWSRNRRVEFLILDQPE